MWPAEQTPACASGDAQAERIRLAESLWDITCRHLLGCLSGGEYRYALDALCSAGAGGLPQEPAAPLRSAT